jgi:6-phosphogluconolactonase
VTTKAVPGQLVATKNSEELAQEAASRISRALVQTIAKNGKASFALSGGNTPRPTYERLSREKGIDWTKVDIFWIDDRAVPPTHDRSNYLGAKKALLDAAKIPAGHIHRMQGEATDLAAAAREYERVLREHVPADSDGIPAIDVAVMGIGDDAHTASLFPGEPTIDITDRLVSDVGSHAGLEPRLTLTVPAIEHIRHVFLLVEGASKRPALERIWAIQGDVHQTPGRIFRGCRGAVTWIIDQAAGGSD